MNKRQLAKAEVMAVLMDNGICGRTHLSMRPDALDEAQEALERMGYSHPGTRRCIINEALREAGMASTRDTYRSRVYNWEDRVLAKAIPGLDKIRDFDTMVQMINKVCQVVGAKPVKVKLRNRGSRSLANVWTRRIELLPSMVTVLTSIHELAHILYEDSRPKGYKEGSHGPRFVAVELGLMAAVTGASLDHMLELADTHKVPCNKNLAQSVLKKASNSGD